MSGRHRVPRARGDEPPPINGEIKRRTDVVSIFPNEAAAVRLVGAIMLAQPDEWTTQRARYMTPEAISTASDTATVRLSAVPA